MPEASPKFKAAWKEYAEQDGTDIVSFPHRRPFLAGYTAGYTARDGEVARLREALETLISTVPSCHFAHGIDGVEYHLLSDPFEGGSILGAPRGQCVWCQARKALADQPEARA